MMFLVPGCRIFPAADSNLAVWTQWRPVLVSCYHWWFWHGYNWTSKYFTDGTSSHSYTDGENIRQNVDKTTIQHFIYIFRLSLEQRVTTFSWGAMLSQFPWQPESGGHFLVTRLTQVRTFHNYSTIISSGNIDMSYLSDVIIVTVIILIYWCPILH